MTNLRKFQTKLFVAMLLGGVAMGATQIIAETTTTTTTVEKTIIRAPTVAPEVKTTVTTKTMQEIPVASEMTMTTKETTLIPTGTRVFNIVEFDLNKDMLLTRREVGEQLFRFYDTDGNQVIDNIEFERKAVLTVHPVEKQIVVTYDLDGDGLADAKQVSYETFLEYTALARFDTNKDGLSPHEFMGRHFMEADVNNDKMVDMKEWEGSYDAQIDARNKREAETNPG